MAEFVQQSLEEMLPELEQMERIGLFTSAETRSILKKRKSYEYKLRRRTKNRDDYLQYIQYEMNVLGLVRKRRERMGYNFKRAEIDIAIVQRIHKLFKLACWRFQADEKLWLSHIDFCKKRKEKATAGRLYTKMLQIHNRKPELWIAAAKWEMEDNLSMENARGLLQRAIRFNPESQTLWVEYFRMELLNADKLIRRKDILGLAHMDVEGENIPDAVTEGKVAQLVYSKAMEAIPENLEFGLKFLPIVRLFSFANSIEEEIFSSLETQFGNEELIWHAKATRQFHKIFKLSQSSVDLEKIETQVIQLESECMAVLEEAVKTVSTEKMWSLYVETCLELIGLKSSKYLNEKRICGCLKVMERASSWDLLSHHLAIEWIELLKQCGLVEDLSRVTEELTRGRHQKSVDLWTERLLWVCKDGEQFYTEYQQAVSSVNQKEALPLFEIGLQWAVINDQDKIEDILKEGLLFDPEVCIHIKEKYLEWTAIAQGLDKAKRLYSRLSSSKPLSMEYFAKYISILSSQPEPKMKRLRGVYEDALLEYGSSNSDLWLDYIKLEQTHPKGKPENASKLHWRAMKMLDSSMIERFTAQYTLLQNDKL